MRKRCCCLHTSDEQGRHRACTAPHQLRSTTAPPSELLSKPRQNSDTPTNNLAWGVVHLLVWTTAVCWFAPAPQGAQTPACYLPIAKAAACAVGFCVSHGLTTGQRALLPARKNQFTPTLRQGRLFSSTFLWQKLYMHENPCKVATTCT